MSDEAKFGEWSPIETAPKDGKDVLATDGKDMLVTYWYGSSVGWIYDFDDYGWHPTHWMPLPEPPTTGATP